MDVMIRRERRPWLMLMLHGMLRVFAEWFGLLWEYRLWWLIPGGIVWLLFGMLLVWAGVEEM